MGNIFDVRRFSTHDGEGIRTTVFFKGCPLDCVWCQNPEGIPKHKSLIYFENKCIFCKSCVDSCENHAIFLDTKLVINEADCNYCGACVKACPTIALKINSTDLSVDELLEAVLSDLPFFKYGGGVTLSGGEPFMQWPFALSLLKELKAQHIHTAVESSLFTSQGVIFKALPFIDTLFADLKIFNASIHKKYTKRSNVPIIKNIESVLQSSHKDKVIIRTPLIPGITATQENIAQISSFISSVYPNVKYELLNYNPLAKAKYDLIGKEFCYQENPMPYSDSQMEEFRWLAIKNGVSNCL